MGIAVLKVGDLESPLPHRVLPPPNLLKAVHNPARDDLQGPRTGQDYALICFKLRAYVLLRARMYRQQRVAICGRSWLRDRGQLQAKDLTDMLHDEDLDEQVPLRDVRVVG